MEPHLPTVHRVAPEWSLYVGDLGRLLVLLAVVLFLLAGLGWAVSRSDTARRRAAPLATLLVAGFGAFATYSAGPAFFARVPLAIAAFLAMVGLLSWAWLSFRTAEGAERVGARSFTLGVGALIGTFVCLGALFVQDQFQYTYVFARASVTTELKYKIAGIWSGQEGSFLLWACMSGIFGVVAARATGLYRRWFTVSYAFFLLFLAAILAYESPFKIDPQAWEAARTMFADGMLASASLPWLPPDGLGMSPSLQNYWVVIHPPTIFAGFGALTVLFAWAVAAMLSGNVRDWAQMVRPWSIVALTILGLGLCMGGFWAYETLGWGGFWAWDPVENVSFVPWCFNAALIHGIIVQVTRKRWYTSNLLLAGLPFLLFVYGTFMTRSGFLEDQSVHSFAEMNRTALWLLVGFLSASTLGFFGLWLFRGLRLGSEAAPADTEGVHREGGYRYGAILLSALGVATAVGMSVPLIQSLIGQAPKRVEEHSYHVILSWVFIPLMLVMAVGPFLSWRGEPAGKFFARILNVFSVSLLLLGLLMLGAKFFAPVGDFLSKEGGIQSPFGELPLYPWMFFLLLLCSFVAVANIWRLAEMWKRGRSSAGAFISHIGVAVLIGGLIFSRGFEQQSEQILVSAGTGARALDYFVEFKGRRFPIETNEDLLNRDNALLFQVTGPNDSFIAEPGHYYLNEEDENGEKKQMRWPYIHHTLFHDVYFTIGNEVTSVMPPFSILPGETKDLGEFKIIYDELVSEGQPGQTGTKFIARLRAIDKDGRVYRADPYMQLQEHGFGQQFSPIGDDIVVSMVGMNAADKSVSLHLFFSSPLYPIQIMYKPMTMLVWGGTGLMTLGGFLAAWARRNRRPLSSASAQEHATIVEKEENAPQPVA